MKASLPTAIVSRVTPIRQGLIGFLAGLALGVVGLLFVLNYNPPDRVSAIASTVFARIAERNEMVGVSQKYQITDKATDSNRFFDLFDIPFTQNSFWYRYVGEIKAGIDLETAEFSESNGVVTITLDQPKILSNTPDMEKSGALEENNNVLNPIHVEDVDKFRSQCIEQSEQEAIAEGLLDEARTNVENNLRDMFTATLGDEYSVKFTYREPETQPAE